MAVRDVVLICVVTFVLGLFCFIMFYTANTMVTEFMDNPLINETVGFEQAMDGTTNIIDKLDYFVLGVFFAFIIGIMVTAWIVGSHPIFAIAFVIVDVIVIAISTIMSHVWDTVTGTSVFGVTVNSFPILNHLMGNFGAYMAGVGILALVIMYAKPSGFRGVR